VGKVKIWEQHVLVPGKSLTIFGDDNFAMRTTPLWALTKVKTAVAVKTTPLGALTKAKEAVIVETARLQPGKEDNNEQWGVKYSVRK
jgi:fumarate hydratase class II